MHVVIGFYVFFCVHRRGVGSRVDLVTLKSWLVERQGWMYHVQPTTLGQPCRSLVRFGLRACTYVAFVLKLCDKDVIQLNMFACLISIQTNVQMIYSAAHIPGRISRRRPKARAWKDSIDLIWSKSFEFIQSALDSSSYMDPRSQQSAETEPGGEFCSPAWNVGIYSREHWRTGVGLHRCIFGSYHTPLLDNLLVCSPGSPGSPVAVVIPDTKTNILSERPTKHFPQGYFSS